MRIEYGSYVIEDFNQLPEASRFKLARGGVAHYIANEVASRVTAFFKEDVEKGNKPSEEVFQAKKKEMQDEAFAKLLSGEINLPSARGPAKDPLEGMIWTLAKESIDTMLKGHNMSKPKSGTGVVKFADGKELEYNKLVEMKIAKSRPELEQAAKKKLEANARAAKKAADLAKEQGQFTLESLGL